MNKIKSRNNKYILIIIVFSLLFVLWLINNNESTVKIYNDIDNTKSELLPYLLEQDNFNNNWSFLSIKTIQKGKLPASGNEIASEYASRIFTGQYQDHKVSIDQLVNQYDTQDNFVNIITNMITKSFPPSEYSIQEIDSTATNVDQKIYCFKESNENSASELYSHCSIFISEGYVLNRVFLTFDSQMIDEDITDIIFDVESQMIDMYY